MKDARGSLVRCCSHVLQHSLLWIKVVWCGVEWCGEVWCDLLWCDVLWCSVVKSCVEW